jgi:hypothetical protein
MQERANERREQGMEREQVREMLEGKAKDGDRVAGKLFLQICWTQDSIDSYAKSIENALVSIRHDAEYVERCLQTGLPLSSSDMTGRGARLDELVGKRGGLEDKLSGMYWLAEEMVGEE